MSQHQKTIQFYFSGYFRNNMENDKHLGTRSYMVRKTVFDGFKNISYEIIWNFLIFGKLKHVFWKKRETNFYKM